MREIAVHLEDELGAVGQRLSKARDVGGAEPLLARPVEYVHVVELLRQAVGEPTGPVRRIVVDHEDTHALFAQRAEHRLEVLALVVCGQADDRGHRATRPPCPFGPWPGV